MLRRKVRAGDTLHIDRPSTIRVRLEQGKIVLYIDGNPEIPVPKVRRQPAETKVTTG